MTENEFIVKSFVETAKERSKKNGTLFITILYNDGNEKDIFPNVNQDITAIITELLSNQTEVNLTSKIILKMSIDENIVRLNEIEIK